MSEKPNILIFMTDQQRADSLYKAKMPNLDRFRKEGLTFTNAYTVSPHCCPSRATFFSGQHPSQHGVWNNVNYGNALSFGFYEGVRLFSEDLHDAGYRTLFSGKWHASALESPLDRGFEIFDEPVKRKNTKCSYPIGDLRRTEYRHTRPSTKNWNRYQHFVQRKQSSRQEGEIVRRGYPVFTAYGTHEDIFQDKDVVADAVKRFREMPKDGKPWLYYIGTLGPHDPYFVPQEYLDMYDIRDIQLPDSFNDTMSDKPALHRRVRDIFANLTPDEHREAIRHYLAFCTFQDALFGEALKALEERGEAENTLVIFCSDHGDYCGEHGLWCKGLPCFRGAYQVPVVARWPKVIPDPGETVDRFITLADFAPTFCDVAGVLDENREYSGRSFAPFLRGEDIADWKDELYTQSNGNELYGIQRSVMTRDWKYVYNGYDYDELYDLNNDPDEMHNVINDPKNAKVVKKLARKVWQFAKKTDDVCVNPYIFVGVASWGPGVIYDDSDDVD